MRAEMAGRTYLNHVSDQLPNGLWSRNKRRAAEPQSVGGITSTSIMPETCRRRKQSASASPSNLAGMDLPDGRTGADDGVGSTPHRHSHAQPPPFRFHRPVTMCARVQVDVKLHLPRPSNREVSSPSKWQLGWALLDLLHTRRRVSEVVQSAIMLQQPAAMVTHTPMRLCTCTLLRLCVDAPVHLCTYAPTHLRTYAPIRLRTYASMCPYAHVPLSLCAYAPMLTKMLGLHSH
ncbi:hypothetical protein M433DRAFT_336796 [Acidomyces richmondensis BFW]|nr:MAG: hypothetical protein FE78DRAFT_478126 [Acidomyces sp. 'richmondensis']KYG43759.1 hypothetical protein M433DRAFT_336796 [Acidomyces richmondensis BFW]